MYRATYRRGGVQSYQIGGDSSQGETLRSQGCLVGLRIMLNRLFLFGLSAAAWIEGSARLEQRPQMFEAHTVWDKGAGFGRVQDDGEGLRGHAEGKCLSGWVAVEGLSMW